MIVTCPKCGHRISLGRAIEKFRYELTASLKRKWRCPKCGKQFVDYVVDLDDPKTVVAMKARSHYTENASCYLAEARAMLKGKNTTNKNRCTKLQGDSK